MANVYAIKSGLWSDTTVWNTGVLPDFVDDVFSNNFTVTIDVSPTVLSVRNEAASPIVAGGGFILSDGVTLTCTGLGIRNANTTCITYSGSGSANIVSNITNNGSSHCLVVNSACTLGIVGNITTTAGNGFASLNLSANCIVNVLGDVAIAGVPGGRCVILSTAAKIDITGNVYMIAGSNGNIGITIDANSTCLITGMVYYQTSSSTTGSAIIIRNNSNGYLKIIGPVNGSSTNAARVAVESTSISAINIFSGPFICDPTGIQPVYVARMHYQRTIGSYFEFRDDSTNGALPPAAPAPATRLVSPETGADLPAQSDVRKGIVYALGTLEGTMNIPDPANVRKDIPVDDTVGTGVLDASGIFDVLTPSLTAPGSIGERLKNVSTVDTTGTQLQNLT